MNRYLIRVLLTAGAFYYLFPSIRGVHFHGNFVHALLAGAVFALVGWFVEVIALAITGIFTIGTLGLGLIVLIPLWLLGFWILPAIALRVMADIMPATLSFTGWTPAIWGGLIMLGIGVITDGNPLNKFKKISASKDPT